MKFLVAFALAVACVHADVSHIVKSYQDVHNVKSESDVRPDGFEYSYENSDGTYAQARGVLVNPNSEAASLAVNGQFGYVDENGQKVETTYVADENGYQPQGSHLPVPPPIPEAILRSIEYIRTHAKAEDNVVRVAPTVVRTAAPVVVSGPSAVASAFASTGNVASQGFVPARSFNKFNKRF